jgi:hypothetical protein
LWLRLFAIVLDTTSTNGDSAPASHPSSTCVSSHTSPRSYNLNILSPTSTARCGGTFLAHTQRWLPFGFATPRIEPGDVLAVFAVGFGGDVRILLAAQFAK